MIELRWNIINRENIVNQREKTHSFAMLDIDNFKKVNDNFELDSERDNNFNFSLEKNFDYEMSYSR